MDSTTDSDSESEQNQSNDSDVETINVSHRENATRHSKKSTIDLQTQDNEKYQLQRELVSHDFGRLKDDQYDSLNTQNNSSTDDDSEQEIENFSENEQLLNDSIPSDWEGTSDNEQSSNEHSDNSNMNQHSDIESNQNSDNDSDKNSDNDDPDHNSSPHESDQDLSTNDSLNDRNLLYTDVQTVTSIISAGMLTVKQFKEAQNSDNFCSEFLDTDKNVVHRNSRFRIIDGLLFRDVKSSLKLVLPKSLFEAIIATKHFTVYGSHNSMSRILRDVRKHFYIPSLSFEKKLREVTKSCYLCQIFNTNCPAQEVKQLPKVNAPRISWSIDMITDTPKTSKGNTQILLCVDDYTSYVMCIPVKSASAEDMVEALRDHLFAPFGIPKIIRSDQQASFYNSTTFCDFLTNQGVTLTATAVASPFSNSRAESQIKNIKHLARKFLFQEHLIANWDEHIQLLTNSHNKSVGIYGYSAEELMFGNQTPSKIDILSFLTPNLTQEEYAEHVFLFAESQRKRANERKDKKNKANNTYKNQNKALKQFEISSLVIHKQLQASTGSSSKYKPLYTGPYTVVKINNDRCTALLEHLNNNNVIKAHFTNMQKLYYSPSINKLSDSFDEKFLQLLGDKYSLNKYQNAKTPFPKVN